MPVKLFFKAKDKWDTDPGADSYQNNLEFDVRKYSHEWKTIRNNLEWHPYTYWKFRPFKGQYISVNGQGHRNTLNLCKNADIRVVILGGSTVWGVGVRDNFTIASHLAEILYQKHVKVEVINLGQIGYITTQDVFSFVEYIKTNPIPQYVITYNGVNDILAGVENNAPGIPYKECNRKKEFNILKSRGELAKAFVRSFYPGDTVDTKKAASLSDEQLISATLNNYKHNIILAEALKEKYHFLSFHYLQPTIFHKNYLSEYEQRQLVYLSKAKPYISGFYDAVKQDPELSCMTNFKDLSNILQQLEHPCFVDCAHLSEDGNAIIARRISEDILQSI